MQYSLFTSAERIARAWLKNRISSLCAWKESVIWSAHVSPFVALSPAVYHERIIFFIHSSFYHDTRTRTTIGTTRSTPRTPSASWTSPGSPSRQAAPSRVTLAWKPAEWRKPAHDILHILRSSSDYQKEKATKFKSRFTDITGKTQNKEEHRKHSYEIDTKRNRNVFFKKKKNSFNNAGDWVSGVKVVCKFLEVFRQFELFQWCSTASARLPEGPSHLGRRDGGEFRNLVFPAISTLTLPPSCLSRPPSPLHLPLEQKHCWSFVFLFSLFLTLFLPICLIFLFLTFPLFESSFYLLFKHVDLFSLLHFLSFLVVPLHLTFFHFSLLLNFIFFWMFFCLFSTYTFVFQRKLIVYIVFLWKCFSVLFFSLLHIFRFVIVFGRNGV